MAGTSQSYYRKTGGGSFIIKTKDYINLKGETVQISYREWDAYVHGYTPGNNVMDNKGKCISNSGMSSGYYEQGPEHGKGGPQI